MAKVKCTAKTAGFTLIELLVVISIIGLLASVVLVGLNNARTRSRDTRRVADMNQVAKAMEMYYSENGHYPTSTLSIQTSPAGGILSSANAPGLNKFLVSFPVAPDPAEAGCAATNDGGNDYWYKTNNTGTTYTVTFCLGDSNPGGIGIGTRHMTPGGFR